MKKIIVYITALIISTTAATASDYAMTSFPVMMLENYGARNIALAGSGVAITDDLNSITVNPAGISGIKRFAFSSMKLDWMFGTSFYMINGVCPLGRKGKSGTLGIATVLFNISDFSTVIDGSSTGSSESGDYCIGLTYANNIFRFFNEKAAEKVHLDFGVSVKYARSTLADYTASALSFDAGINFSFAVPALALNGSREDTMTLSIVFRNLSLILSSFTDSGETIVPWYFSGGFRYRFLCDKRHNAALTTSLTKPSDNDFMLASGLEYAYRETIILRVGYKLLGREHESVSFGFGLNFELSDRLAFRFDYASVDLAGFGKSDTFSLSVLF